MLVTEGYWLRNGGSDLGFLVMISGPVSAWAGWAALPGAGWAASSVVRRAVGLILRGKVNRLAIFHFFKDPLVLH